jgi:hypothetical protein
LFDANAKRAPKRFFSFFSFSLFFLNGSNFFSFLLIARDQKVRSLYRGREEWEFPYDSLMVSKNGLVNTLDSGWSGSSRMEYILKENEETKGWCWIADGSEYFMPTWNDNNGPMHANSIYNQ